ncbi:Phosphate-specific transport system accessory protein PhoU [Candidatus Promineifilum breve]|uniref:Phosphate-specific transport system accessory protein PhoU n=1 Tax=Candidatus Promineifilum breve TaxID=1806508 RepID=A0A160T8Q3_9CHLR|nr:phosphate signaling complex protein PhoU [Candidatus Promineifilum breve]CUS05555.1 Phosphate-specific transport system accessory protein PhoU [Candidatus Promineifilum breve]
MRQTFDRDLQRLQDEVLRMGSEVEEHLVTVTNAFLARDAVTAQRMIDADKSINERRVQVGLDALTLIAIQSPMARDMRLIAAILEIVGELERIHDYVKGIGKISLSLGREPIPAPLARDLPEMAEIAREMLFQALKAFANRDETLARRVPAMDDRVDELFNHLYGEIVALVTADATQIHRANQLEWALHNMERSADRTINICEWVVYMVTGVYSEMSMGEYEAPPG